MQRRNLILLLTLVFFVLASAFLLYRSFNANPLTLAPMTVSSDDIQTRAEVEALKIKIHKAVGTVEAGGDLERLTADPQFKTLMAETPVTTDIGVYGRTNPFLPVQ